MAGQRRSPSSESSSGSESESEQEVSQSELRAKTQLEKVEPPQAEASETESESEVQGENMNSKPAAGAKALLADSSAGKRGRDVKAAAPADEPPSKKKREPKEEKVTRPQLATVAGGEKGGKVAERASRSTKTAPAAKGGEKAKDVPAGKVEKAENGKPQAAGRKRKASSPPPKKGQGQKSETEKPSPPKPKRPVTWTTALEASLVTQLFKDHSNGTGMPNGKGHPYWEELWKRLPHGEDGFTNFTPVQLCEKGKRMRARYLVLKERPKGEGGKLFKNPHEERIFRKWEAMWGSGKPSAAEEEDEDDDSEEESAGPSASIPAALLRTETTDVPGEDSSSEDENEGEDSGDAKRKMVAVNQILVASKPETELATVSPFLPKPKLAFTPYVPKELKRNPLTNIETLPNGDEKKKGDDEKKGAVFSLGNDQLKQLREEMFAFCEERLQALGEQRNESARVGLGDSLFSAQGLGYPGMLERLGARSGSKKGLELQKKVREHKIRELQHFSEKLELLQEECHLEMEELELLNQAENS